MQAVSTEQQFPFTDVNPYGANFFLDREVETWKKEKTLSMAQEAGIGWIKQQFSWEEIEPQRKGEFNWEKYDQIVELSGKYGMRIIARLDRTPDWSRENNQFSTRPPDDLKDFGDFVSAFVHRYGDRVHYIQIWNEPNLTAEWGFERVDAVAYTELLEVAYHRAKQADPNIVVLSAPLAITLEDASMRGNHNDLIFLEQMYQAGAGQFFDILSANAFGLDRPPEDPPAPDVLNFRRVELQRAIMEKYGDEPKPIWINEFGWNASPPSFAEELLTWKRVTEDQQADYTVRGIAWARSQWPWLGVVNIWYFRQVGDILPDRSAFYFGLVDPEFDPKPVYSALRQVAAAPERSIAQSGQHQDSSPAIVATGWRLVLDPDASSGTALVSEDASSSLTFRFEGQQVELVTVLGPEQGRLHVQVDGQAPDKLAADDSRWATIDLQAERLRAQATVRLAENLGTGIHQVTLSPAGPAHVVVDAFIVSDESSRFSFGVLWGMCAAFVVAGAALWLAESLKPAA